MKEGERLAGRTAIHSIAEQVPDGRLHVFPTDVASSHFPFLENPAAFNAVVEEFLDRG